jgi:3-oxoacyl-[acyl-carrier-protein] synthase-3
MQFKFENKKISGILAVLPSKVVHFADEISNYPFSEKQSVRLAKVMGYSQKRIALESEAVSDYATKGIELLLKEGYLRKEEIDAILVVTQTPDHFLPPVSNIIQGRLSLDSDTYCIDMNQGCAGYEVGLFHAFQLLETSSIKKVVLVVGDVLSKRVSVTDRNSRPLIGDAVTVSVVERAKQAKPIYMNIKMDGKGAFVLQIPAGGFRLPSSKETSVLEKDSAGNIRAKDHLVMQGDAVFNFVQSEVPPLIDELMEFSGDDKEEIDYFLFHQPNKFMLEKLADKMKIPREKIPCNIVENFGNSSSATVPLNICFNLGEKAIRNRYKVCLAGFGVGLTWSSISMELGDLDFCRIVDFKT